MPPIRVVDEKQESEGLHVVDIEFPPVPPRYSLLNILRIPTWFSSTRQSSNVQPLPEIEAATLASDQRQPTIASSTVGSQTALVQSNSINRTYNGADAPEILDRKLFGWTWRRWIFILGPCLAIVVMAVTLVAVFVARGTSDSNNGPTSTITPTPVSATPSAAATTMPVPTASVPPSVGALNGTSIAAAIPDNGQDDLWVFYQDSTGNINHIPLDQSGTWGRPSTLLPVGGVLNGTAIAAINFAASTSRHINLIYQDAQGNLQNLVYNNNSNHFSTGRFNNFAVELPNDPDVVKRLAWYTDGQYYHYIYFAGPDGTVREYTYNMKTNAWTSTFTFPYSNGYAGYAVLYDTSNVMTMHLINQAGQLQLFWRNYTNVNFANPAPQWTAGDVIPSASTPLGFDLNINSSLALTQQAGQAVFVQERHTNAIWSVGWQGSRDQQKWTTGVAANVTAISNSGMSIERLAGGGPVIEYAFVQQAGNDVTLLQKTGATFSTLGKLPLDG